MSKTFLLGILHVVEVILERWTLNYKAFWKFNVHGAARGKVGLTSVYIVLHDNDSVLWASSLGLMFIKGSNEAEILAIREAIKIFGLHFLSPLIVEGTLRMQLDRWMMHDHLHGECWLLLGK